VQRPLSLPTQHRGGLVVYSFPHLAEVGVDAFVTGREGGVSTGPYESLNLGTHVEDEFAAVVTNRSLVSQVVGAPLVIARQVHGSTILEGAEVEPGSEADALVTRSSDLAVAVLVADCVPLVLVNPRRHELAVVHAGWRGMAAGIIEAAISQLGDPTELLVGVGPSISGAAYQVGPDVVGASPLFARHAREDGTDRSRLDLRACSADIVLAAGVASERLVVSTQVTDGGRNFFSDRTARPCGRFALVARWAS